MHITGILTSALRKISTNFRFSFSRMTFENVERDHI